MGSFAWGMLAGGVVMLIAAAIVGVVVNQRIVRLHRRAQQAERLAELGTLTGGLAHEIKNPLSTVQLNLQLLREDIPSDPAFTRIINRLGTVQREAARLKDILDDFLRYAGKLEVEPRPTNLNDLLEELVDFYTPQAQLQRVQLRLKKEDRPLVVPCDPKLIKQAVLNLMINGLQAMSDRGGELILRVSRNEDSAFIDVIDTGKGIPPEAAEKIFDAYYSTKKGGTGLGLAMTRRIALEHGGDLTVKSESGKGSDFTLRLPLIPDSAPARR